MTAAGAIGATAQAEAALYYWSDSDSGYYRPAGGTAARQKPAPQSGKKIETAEKESAKPQGPLIIAISIDKQNVKIYDANGFFAEAPVSTGMKGHPTPMGVFSVIQKQKMHHSNIYSGAPMPFMQRITWSGVAMHAGVLPGYPASHGCIRMPMAFAVKMWNWTRMGARVIVTPGELSPCQLFASAAGHAEGRAAAVAAEPQADAPPAPKSRQGFRGRHTDQAGDFGGETRTEIDRRPRRALAADDRRAAASTSLREQTHTADASGGVPMSQPAATMSDAVSVRRPCDAA